MKIKELSTDNIVQYKDENGQFFVCTIQNIYKNSDMVKLKWIENTETDNGFLTDIKNVEPVELTMKFLTDNGFKASYTTMNINTHENFYLFYQVDDIKVYTNILSKKNTKIDKFKIDREEPYKFVQNLFCSYQILYVHQLQNMFSLNGIEKEWIF